MKNEFRIIKNHRDYYLQERKRFLFIEYWSTLTEQVFRWLDDNPCYEAVKFNSVEQAETRVQLIRARRKEEYAQRHAVDEVIKEL